MKQSASETRKRTVHDMKTNFNTFVGAGVCNEALCLFAEGGTALGASGANVTNLAA
jgi:hypothetical protein